MSLVVLLMTIVLIVVDDRLPILSVLLFALVIAIPAAAVDALVLFGRGSGQSREPLARPRRPRPHEPRRHRRRRDDETGEDAGDR